MLLVKFTFLSTFLNFNFKVNYQNINHIFLQFSPNGIFSELKANFDKTLTFIETALIFHGLLLLGNE